MTRQSAHKQLAELRPDLYDDLLNWVRFGQRPESDLVVAVLHNNLQKAIGLAGTESLMVLRLLAQTVWNYIPDSAWRDDKSRILWHTERAKEPMPNFKFGDC